MLFEIHQDRAIDPALAEGKIIDAQDPGRGLGGRRRATENPQDRIATEGHPQAGGHPGAGFTAGLAPEDADGLGQPPGTLRVRGGKRWEAFGKGLAWTRGRETAETPDGHAEAHRVLRDGEIAEAACVTAMHARRRGVRNCFEHTPALHELLLHHAFSGNHQRENRYLGSTPDAGEYFFRRSRGAMYAQIHCAITQLLNSPIAQCMIVTMSVRARIHDTRVDAAAKRRGMRRSSWMQLTVSRALDQGEG